MKILLAVRKEEKNQTISTLQKTDSILYAMDTFSNSEQLADEIDLSFVDEDFDGLESGWRLASRIRQLSPLTRIVMITRKNPGHDYLSLYDATLGFPVSEEELIGEIQRG